MKSFNVIKNFYGRQGSLSVLHTHRLSVEACDKPEKDGRAEGVNPPS